MNILQNIRLSLASWIGGSSWTNIGSGGMGARLNLPGITRPAENIPTVYAALQARVGAIQQAALRISSGDNLVTGGDLFDLLARPARNYDFTHWLGTVEAFLTLYNMAFVAKVGEAGRNPDELMPLSPRYMEPIIGEHSPTGTAVALQWRYNDPFTGRQVLFQPEELIVINGVNPHAPLRALAPSDAGLRTMQADLAARESNLAIFLNGGTPSLMLGTEQRLDKAQADELIQGFRDNIGGIRNARKIALFHSGLKPFQIGLSPMEMQYLEGLRFSTQELLMVFRVMPAMLGVMTGETGLSQGSSTQEQKLAWWEDVGIPELARIAGAIQNDLVAKHRWTTTTRAMTRAERAGAASAMRGNSLMVWFDENQIPALVKHRLAKLEQFTKLLNTGYAPDDLNTYLDLGLPPHPTNIGVIPLGVQKVTDLTISDAAPQTDVPARAVEVADTSHGSAGRGGDLQRALEKLGAALERTGNGTRAKNDALRKKFLGLVKSHTKVGARKISGYFVEQSGRVRARFEAATRGLRHGANGAVSVGALVRSELDDLMAKIFPLFEENELLTKRMLGAWVEALTDGWNLTNEQAGLTDHSFTIDDPNIVKAIAARKINGSKMNDTTAEDLRKIIAAGIEAGDSSALIGDAIADYYRKQIGENAARPQTAARTQMAGIVNDGQMAAARDAGNLKKIWIHGNPEESRPAHEAAERDYADGIELDQAFVVDGVSMDAPGDADAPIEQTANCTCMVGFKR